MKINWNALLMTVMALVVVIACIIAGYVGWPEYGDGGGDPVIVAKRGGSPAPSPIATPIALPATTPVPSVADFSTLTVVERNIAIAARPRDGIWAPAAEASLAQAVNAIGGMRIDHVRCASAACELVGILDPANGRDQESSVAMLQDGPVQRAYAAAGFAPNGHMTINADDRGALHFTQYLGAVR